MTKIINKGKIFLIPTPIADETVESIITPQIREVINNCDYFLCENIRTTRRYFSSLRIEKPIDSLIFEKLDKDTNYLELQNLMKPVIEGKDLGVLSEAGCPGIADPGSLAVKFAHANNIQVVPLSGPSSIFLALMASGFNGQSFVFHGYVPINEKEKISFIRNIEKGSLKKETQIFMETPYRNDKLFELLLKTLGPSTYLCVAKNITAQDENITSLPVKEWKQVKKPDLHKVPVIFLIFNY
jgi:16S rRNA (cytidine1402-2'-O)-methyltransferase